MNYLVSHQLSFILKHQLETYLEQQVLTLQTFIIIPLDLQYPKLFLLLTALACDNRNVKLECADHPGSSRSRSSHSSCGQSSLIRPSALAPVHTSSNFVPKVAGSMRNIISLAEDDMRGLKIK